MGFILDKHILNVDTFFQRTFYFVGVDNWNSDFKSAIYLDTQEF